jgi:hypothetical protein
MQGRFFILNPRKYRDFCVLKRAVTMEWQAYLAKPGRIQDFAFEITQNARFLLKTLGTEHRNFNRGKK